MEECFKNYIQKFSKNINISDNQNTSNTSCNRCVIEKSGYAQAYIPYQEDTNIMKQDKSFYSGTAFSALVMPYEKNSALKRFNVKE